MNDAINDDINRETIKFFARLFGRLVSFTLAVVALGYGLLYLALGACHDSYGLCDSTYDPKSYALGSLFWLWAGALFGLTFSTKSKKILITSFVFACIAVLLAVARETLA